MTQQEYELIIKEIENLKDSQIASNASKLLNNLSDDKDKLLNMLGVIKMATDEMQHLYNLYDNAVLNQFEDIEKDVAELIKRNETLVKIGHILTDNFINVRANGILEMFLGIEKTQYIYEHFEKSEELTENIKNYYAMTEQKINNVIANNDYYDFKNYLKNAAKEQLEGIVKEDKYIDPLPYDEDDLTPNERIEKEEQFLKEQENRLSFLKEKLDDEIDPRLLSLINQCKSVDNQPSLEIENISNLGQELIKNVDENNINAILLNKETDAKMWIEKGHLTPYELQILDVINTFSKNEKLLTSEGTIVATCGQMFRALYGSDAKPTKEYLDSFNDYLKYFATKWVTIKYNEPTKAHLGFTATSFEDTFIKYRKYNGKNITGFDDYLYEFNVPILNIIADKFFMTEDIEKDVRTPKEIEYTMHFKNNLICCGNKRQCDKFMAAKGLKKEDIETTIVKFNKLPSTKDRINLNSYLIRVVLRYIKAKDYGSQYSNKIPYEDIFKYCEIDTTYRTTIKRHKEYIFNCFDWWQHKGYVLEWKEYTNKNSKVANGIEFNCNIDEKGVNDEIL